MPDNDDVIIATCLLLIKKGIETNDWQFICDGYNGITGEDISPPTVKTKSKLERIKELMSSGLDIEEKSVSKAEPQEDLYSLTVKELKDRLVKNGSTEKKLKNLKKDDLVKMLSAPAEVETEAVEEDDKDMIRGKDEEGNDIDAVVKNVKGGTRFARDGLQIIEAVPDPEEVAKNKKTARKNTVQRQKINFDQYKTSKDDASKDVGYYDKPNAPPSWRG